MMVRRLRRVARSVEVAVGVLLFFILAMICFIVGALPLGAGLLLFAVLFMVFSVMGGDDSG